MNSVASNGKDIEGGVGTTRPRLGHKHLGLLFGIALLGVSPAMTAQQPVETYYPLLPKYQVLGVIYSPPGATSDVSYDQSTTVGSAHSQSFTSSKTQTQTTITTSGFSLYGLGTQTQNTVSDTWMTATENASSVSITSVKTNGIKVTGPAIGSSVGVDHDFDLIAIWLNPLTNTTLTYNPSVTPNFSFVWQGYQYNSCELGNSADPVNFYQLISGCDPLQGLEPDIVYMPVVCLKNPFSQALLPMIPNTCVQWWQNQGQELYLSRYWDQNSWGADPKTGVPLGPMLTVQDLADILRADPYITQTLVADNYQTGDNPYTSPCHPTYGLDFNPDSTEAIPDSSKFLPPFSGTWPTDYCGKPGVTMARHDNQGTTVPYQTSVNKSGTLSRTVMSTFSTMATDTHTHSVNQTTTNSFDFSASIGIPLGEGVSLSSSLFSESFNFSSSSGTGSSWTDTQSWSKANTTGVASDASWSITGPAATDNYTGPTTFNVYDDNVYGTFSFWSPQTLLNPPTLPTSSPIGVKMVTANGVTCSTPTTCNFGTVTVGKSSGAITVTLTNASPYQMTIVSPSLSFSDLAPDATSSYAQVSSFVIAAGTDLCAGKVLAAGKTCTVKIKFSPRLAAAPNVEKASYPVNAYMVASGTEGIPFYTGGTCTTGYCSSVLVTNTVVNVTGPGLETFTTVSGTAVPAAANCTGIKPSCDIGATLTPATLDFPDGAISGTQVYTFKNYASTSVSVTGIQLTDTTDYSITSNTCTGVSVPSLSMCTFTLVYAASGPGPTRNTEVSVLSGTTTLAYAGAAALYPVILRPTTYTGVTGWTPYTNPQLALDGNLTTTAAGATHSPVGVSTGAKEVWSGWSKISGTPKSVVLYIVWDASCVGGGTCGNGVSYTASNGVVGNTTDRPSTETTETFTLPTNIDLTTLQVTGGINCFGGQPGFGSGENCVQSLFEVYVAWTD